MTVLYFIISLAGAVTLLQYGVHTVQSGVDNLLGASFKLITHRQKNQAQAASLGVCLAVMLQSSTAVALLVSGFASSGALNFAGGLAIILGADLGSALVVQLLSFKLNFLMPGLLFIGGWLFLKAERSKLQQIGRIILGIAFILLSLTLMRETIGPIRQSSFLPSVAAYLQQDYITSFMVGVVLTFVMQSSVAMVLTCITLVSLSIIPAGSGAAIILGANFGSGLIPLWLARDMKNEARQILLANFFIRGGCAILALMVVSHYALVEYSGELYIAQSLIMMHLFFNGTLLLFLPFLGIFKPATELFLPADTKSPEESDPRRAKSFLDESSLSQPKLALSCLKRELISMAQLIENLSQPIMRYYQEGNLDEIRRAQSQDRHINKMLNNIRRYVADLPAEKMSEQENRRANEFIEYAINLEAAGDIISKHILVLCEDKARKKLQFSEEGWQELTLMHNRFLNNSRLAFEVLASGDIEATRQLLTEKEKMSGVERSSRKKHFERLRQGREISFTSSDIHLETLRGLKELNSKISSIAYPLLKRRGHLLKTRLAEEVPPL